jgi:hypothetical protein
VGVRGEGVAEAVDIAGLDSADAAAADRILGWAAGWDSLSAHRKQAVHLERKTSQKLTKLRLKTN